MNDFYVQFPEREIIYDPAEDSWNDDTREAAHEQLAMVRLNRWELAAKAIEEMNTCTG